jgi:hypothetical protein
MDARVGSKFSVCRGSQALTTNRVYTGPVVKIATGWRAEVKTMSRNLAAYLAIVGTLVFAPPGAASAGQVNIPRINIPRPQISIPTPHPSVPTPHLSIPRPQISVPTPRLSSFPKGITPDNNGLRANAPGLRHKDISVGTLAPGSGTGSSSGAHYQEDIRVGTMGPGSETGSSPGSASAMPVSNTGGYPTVETPSFRCRSKGGISNCI